MTKNALVGLAFLMLVAPGCSNAVATCEADCEMRIGSCPDEELNCTALCGTYVALGDSGGCSDERLLYQNCVVDAACSDDCLGARAGLNACVGANSPDPCLRYCRDRADAGCADAGCVDSCIGAEYLARAAGCEEEVDLWVNCLTTGSQCDAGTRCLSLSLDALGCASEYCGAHPEDAACP